MLQLTRCQSWQGAEADEVQRLASSFSCRINHDIVQFCEIFWCVLDSTHDFAAEKHEVGTKVACIDEDTCSEQ